jgi:hypothetical protein
VWRRDAVDNFAKRAKQAKEQAISTRCVARKAADARTTPKKL